MQHQTPPVGRGGAVAPVPGQMYRQGAWEFAPAPTVPAVVNVYVGGNGNVDSKGAAACSPPPVALHEPVRDGPFSSAPPPGEPAPSSKMEKWVELLTTSLLVLTAALPLLLSIDLGSDTVTLTRPADPAYDAFPSLGDVVGLGETADVLEEAVLARRHGLDHAPNGILLQGPPGCGKTMTAKALARELGLPLVYVHCSRLRSKWMGESVSKARDAFRQAVRRSPCVLFLDELDAVGNREALSGGDGAASEEYAVINEMLTMLDHLSNLSHPRQDAPARPGWLRRTFRSLFGGAAGSLEAASEEAKRGVLLVAATNHADHIDPALMRSGRFDYKLTLPAPGAVARRRLLQKETGRGNVFLRTREMDVIVELLADASPADLLNLLRRAALFGFARLHRRASAPDGVQASYCATFDDVMEVVRRDTLGMRMPDEDVLDPTGASPSPRGALGTLFPALAARLPRVATAAAANDAGDDNSDTSGESDDDDDARGPRMLSEGDLLRRWATQYRDRVVVTPSHAVPPRTPAAAKHTLRRVVHEAGHAVLGLYHCRWIRLVHVSVETRAGGSGGAVFSVLRDGATSQAALTALLDQTLAGYVAEKLWFAGDVSLGPSSDLERAEKLARRLVTQFSVEDLGLLPTTPAGRADSGPIADRMAERQRELLGERIHRVTRVLDGTVTEPLSFAGLWRRLVTVLLVVPELSSRDVLRALGLRPKAYRGRGSPRGPRLELRVPMVEEVDSVT